MSSDRFFSPSGFTVRLAERVARLPNWLRPAAFGSLLIVFLMGLRGAFVLGPILLLILLFTSPAPVAELGVILACFSMAIVAGGVSGLVYSLVGRWIQRIPFVGPYAAGIISVIPYMFVVAIIANMPDRTFVMQFKSDDLVIGGLMCVIFGPIVGHYFMRPHALD